MPVASPPLPLGASASASAGASGGPASSSGTMVTVGVGVGVGVGNGAAVVAGPSFSLLPQPFARGATKGGKTGEKSRGKFRLPLKGPGKFTPPPGGGAFFSHPRGRFPPPFFFRRSRIGEKASLHRRSR